MPLTIPEMVAKGKKALTRAAPRMKANYDDAKPRMKTSYGALPFGNRTKAAYNAGIDDAVYVVPDIEKWGKNWPIGVGR